MENEKKLYFVLIRLGGDGNIMSRVRESAPRVKSVVEELSQKECQLVFTTSDGSSFGYFLKTSAPLPVVRSELYGKSTNSTGSTPLLNDDSLLVFEVGPDFTGSGFSRAWTWLHYHQ